MTAIAFPSSPSIGNTYAQPNGYVYTWNGTAWLGTSGGAGGGVGLSGTWHDVTSSRSSGVTYTNNRSYSIAVSATGSFATGSPALRAYVDGVLVSVFNWQFNGAGARSGGFIIVGPGSTYQLFFDGSGISNWAELY